ncbi:MAG: carbohydrate porin [Candidatus Margulisiibacteriota bacterium]|jgi:porin
MKKNILGMLMLLFLITSVVYADNTNLAQQFGIKQVSMNNNGFTSSLTYVSDTLTNVIGGAEKSIAYDHSFGLSFAFDMTSLMKVSGYTFNLSGLARTGQDLSKSIGNNFRPSSLYGCEELRLYGVFVKSQQTMQDGTQRTMKIGRFSAGDDFDNAVIYWNIINNAIDGNPVNVFFSSNFLSYPNAVWGAFYQIDFLQDKSFLPKNMFAKLGVYDGDTTIPKEGSGGINFGLAFKNGLFIPFEIGFTVDQDQDSVKKLPGIYKLGVYDSTGYSGDTLLTRRFHNYGGYLQAQQMLYREPDAATKQGLTGFGGIDLAPSNSNKIPLFLFGGLTYEGLFDTRAKDVTSFGLAYGRWSWDIDKTKNPKNYEVIFDLSYKIVFTDWLYLQPDIQYIVAPISETGQSIPNAFVVGTRVGIILL